MMLSKKEIANFWKDGFIIVRDVYSKDEISEYRNFVSKESVKYFGNESSNYKELEVNNFKEILSYPEIQSVILNKKLIDSVKNILEGEVVYWGNSSFRWNEKAYRRFHNDAKNDFDCPFTTKYPLVRVGVYLQDHSSYSNGLKIWKGTRHTLRYGRKLLKKIFKENGSLKYLLPQQFYKSINVNTKAGDVVISNLRTCHSGGALRIKYLSNISFHPIVENFIERYLPSFVLPLERERGVLFSTFGKESNDLNNYIQNNLKHPEISQIINNSSFLGNEYVNKKSLELGLKLKNIFM